MPGTASWFCADRQGVLRYELHPGSITGCIFQDFLSALPAVQGRSLVMDNAVIHHSKRILPGVARLAEDGDLSLRYLVGSKSLHAIDAPKSLDIGQPRSGAQVLVPSTISALGVIFSNKTVASC